MSSQDIDAATLALLTPEEIAAIQDEPSDSERAALQSIADGGDDDVDDVDDGDGDDGAAVVPAAAPSPAAEPEPEPKSEPAAAAESVAESVAAKASPPPEFQAEYVATLPDDFDARKTANAAAETAAFEQFKAGDLDAGELQIALGEVARERTELDRLQTKAEMSQEMRGQKAEQTWMNTVGGFMTDTARAGGVDYRVDAGRAADLDTFVKALAGNDANSDKPMAWFLSEAHKRVLALHGETPQAAAVALALTPAQTKAAAVAARKPDASAAPQSLAQVPGSSGPGDIGGEFAGLDTLTGDALEDAIGRMSPAQREKYARGQ